MATLVQISGGPGTGKTFAAKTLPSDKTFMFDVDGKGLSWAGWRKDYSTEKGNYAAGTESTPLTAGLIMKYCKKISDEHPEKKYIYIDTVSTIMSDREVDDMKLKGYDKWKDFAIEIYNMYRRLPQLRNDLIIFVAAHTMPIDQGEFGTKLVTKTGGKKLTSLNLAGKLNYNLYTNVERFGKGEEAKYTFITQSDGNTEARSTYGVLDFEIPNDLYLVAQAIEEKDLQLT